MWRTSSGGTSGCATPPSARAEASAATRTKPALRIDFNRYTTGQRFLGLKSLVLDNLWQHGSFVAESTTMAFFERMGQPAPRESFCRLYINNVFHGVYAIVEVDRHRLSRADARRECRISVLVSAAASGFYGDYLGDDLLAYKRRFEPQSHELESDAILYAPIRDLFREVNHPDDGVWRDRVEQYLDLQQFMTHVAIENFLAEIDGIARALLDEQLLSLSLRRHEPPSADCVGQGQHVRVPGVPDLPERRGERGVSPRHGLPRSVRPVSRGARALRVRRGGGRLAGTRDHASVRRWWRHT